MKRRGFTLVELLAVMIILVVLSTIVIPSVYSMIKSSKDKSYEILISSFEENTRLYASRYREEVENNLDLYDSYIITLNDLKEDNLLKTPVIDPRTDEIIGLDKTIIITKEDDNTLSFCFEDRGCSIPVNSYSVYKGVNKPELIEGMVPVKWNGSAWIQTTEDDDTWYSYTATDKKWANAMTADGSYWVWIPRFAYQIQSGYNSSTAGVINIKFLVNKTNKTDDGVSVSLTPAYSGDSQTNYVVHPAFTFGYEEVKGIWVAKFEASGTTNAITIKPYALSLRSISVSDMYQAARNMETNDNYGWGTTGEGLDTHMMKNTEWGAVTYLAHSKYGANTQIWINPNNSYLTGCAGDSADASATSGCNQYNTSYGMKASTTSNISGIYDMSGGSWEFVMGNLNNTTGSSGITSVSAIESQYINRYTGYTVEKIGDAIAETSSTSSGSNSWFGDYSLMISSSDPWFTRGGYYSSGANAGTFSFSSGTGAGVNGYSFRPTLIIGAEF